MIQRPDHFMKTIVYHFGLRICIALASVYFGLKGIAYQFVLTANLPYFKNLGVSGSRYQKFSIISQLPWSLKAIFGIMCDTIPIFGYHKRSYIILSSIFGTLALIPLGIIPFTTSTAVIAALLLIPVHMQLAIVDLLTEGKYAQLMVEKPETGSSLVSYTWALLSLGAFLAALVVGPLADRVNPKYLFLITIPFSIQVIIPAIYGWFPEEKDEENRIKYEKLNELPNLLNLIMAISVASIIISFLSFTNVELQSIISLVICAVLSILGMVWLPKDIGKVNLYLFLTNVFKISLLGALDYFFTADSRCVRNGPQFSMTYYITFVNIVASLAMVMGIILFQQVLSHSTFRYALCVSTFIKIVSSIFDYLIVKRYNLKLGISDKLFFIMGEAIIVPVINMLEQMPCFVLMSKLCPPGIEATIYSLLASYQNLGVIVSRALGILLIKWCNIQTMYPCNFSGLPKAIIIGHGILPALIFPLVFWLIPNAKMTDDLIGQSGSRSTSPLDRPEENTLLLSS